MANFLMGTPSRFERIQKYDPQRQAASNQLLQQALAGLSGTQADFAPIAEREVSRFQTETVPSLAERFTSMGAGSQGSSGFAESLARGGGELGTNLAALGSQHALGQQGNLMQLLNMVLRPQEEIGYFGGTEGALGPISQAAGKYLPAIGGVAGTALGGPVGGAIGTGAGGLVSLLLSLLAQQGQQPQSTGSVSYRPTA